MIVSHFASGEQYSSGILLGLKQAMRVTLTVLDNMRKQQQQSPNRSSTSKELVNLRCFCVGLCVNGRALHVLHSALHHRADSVAASWYSVVLLGHVESRWKEKRML